MNDFEIEEGGVAGLNLDADRAADWAALEKMAGEGAQAAGAVEAVETAQVVPDLEGELNDVLNSLLVPLAVQMWPSVGANLSPDRVKAPCMTFAALCKKRGWLQDGLMGGENAVEIACAFATVPLVIATYKGIRADIAARQPAQPTSVPGELDLSASVPVDAPGAKTVSVGVAV